jgi:hypothetical protein
METMHFEPMSVGRIFDRAFAIYRNNFLRFVTIVAIIEVPLTLLSIATSSWTETKAARHQTFFERMRATQENTRSGAGRDTTDDETPSLLGLVGKVCTTLLTLVGVMLCQAALIKSVSETYLGHEITVGQAYRFALPKALTLIAATICVGLVTGLGLILLIIPGVIFSLWFFLTAPAIVVENRSAGNGMSRSRALVAGNLGKVLSVGLLSILISVIISILFLLLGRMVRTMLPADSAMLRSFLDYFDATVSRILTMPIGATASILLYYDLRIRKEGFDLQMLAQSMTAGQGEPRAV